MQINYELLEQICLAPIETFKALGDVTTTKDGIYIHIGNPDSKILGVAHLDSVLDLDHFYKLDIDKDSIVINAQLDDRLGVYVMLDILPRLGISFDLLLTEGEEKGRSTAKYFKAPKDYNWMFSFDRQLNDVVMYQYDCKELRADLIKAKFTPGIGSFSDIDFLDHLGIRGFNVGTGYYGEHSDMCYASMNMLCNQIDRFQKFYKIFKDKKYPYTPDEKITSWGGYNTRFINKSPYIFDDICYICERPSMKGEEVNGVFICSACMGNAEVCQGCDDIVENTTLINGLCAYCRGEE